MDQAIEPGSKFRHCPTEGGPFQFICWGDFKQNCPKHVQYNNYINKVWLQLVIMLCIFCFI